MHLRAGAVRVEGVDVVLVAAAEVLQRHRLGDLPHAVQELVEEHVQVALEELVGVEELEVGPGATEDPLRSRQGGAPGLEAGEVVLGGPQAEEHRAGNVRDRSRNSTTSAGSIDARYRRRKASEPDADFSVCSQWWNPPPTPAVTSWV